jgi:hypothetical protein
MIVALGRDIYLAGAVLCWILGGGALVVVIFPRFAWMLREAVVAVEINECALFGAEWDEDRFRHLQLKALVYDGVALRGGTSGRLSKLRELYLAMDHRGRLKNFSTKDVENYGRRCLRELTRIVDEEIKGLRPNLQVDGAIVGAKEILRFIANRDREARRLSAVERTSEVEAHFRNSPLTVEQTGELLEAVTYGLIYRAGKPAGLSPTQAGLLSRILRCEQRFRVLVGQVLSGATPDQCTLLKQLEERLPAASLQAVKDRASRGIATAASESESRPLLEFLYLDELWDLIRSRGDLFSGLPETTEEDRQLGDIQRARDRLANGWPITSHEVAKATAACEGMEAWLDEASRKLGWPAVAPH